MDPKIAKAISLFATLADDELKGILRLTRPIHFEKDQPIIIQGQQYSSLFLIEEGVLHVSRKAEKTSVFLGRLDKGCFFGEITLLDPGPATATVKAVGKGTLSEIRKEDFELFLEQNPASGCKVLTSMMREMAARLRRVDERLTNSLFWGDSLSK